MKKLFYSTALLFSACLTQAQLSPAITSWLQNTTVTGKYYIQSNFTPQSNTVVVNCQTVQYSANNVYVSTGGVPSYTTGPFLDGNPSLASNQNALFKFPLAPVQNTNTPTSTTGGDIGVFINGVAMFDYRDGVSWSSSCSCLKGGPLGGAGDGVWNRDAVPAEKAGFDCAKGHPAMGNYHHHQNPSAFKLDIAVTSTVCSLYNSDGLYVIDSTQHSPLLGFAYDGFPVYGAYGYKNVNGTGGIVRMKSSFGLRTGMTIRNTYYTSTVTVTSGPNVSSTYPLGYFKEDYQFNTPTASDYLDIHNGRFCVTPEYPAGTYCYFATVDANWNSTYPYLVGPTFYGVYANRKVTSVTESTTTYTTALGISEQEFNNFNVSVYPNPSNDIVAIQVGSLVKDALKVDLIDVSGKAIKTTTINAGQTIAFFDLQTVYAGIYFIKISNGNNNMTRKIVVSKN
jgi:hypothetical protein